MHALYVLDEKLLERRRVLLHHHMLPHDRQGLKRCGEDVIHRFSSLHPSSPSFRRLIPQEVNQRCTKAVDAKPLSNVEDRVERRHLRMLSLFLHDLEPVENHRQRPLLLHAKLCADGEASGNHSVCASPTHSRGSDLELCYGLPGTGQN